MSIQRPLRCRSDARGQDAARAAGLADPAVVALGQAETTAATCYCQSDRLDCYLEYCTSKMYSSY